MMDSVYVHGWSDAPLALGIQHLTGEACAYSMRSLIDLNEDGLENMIAFLGLPYDTKFAKNSNSMVADKPAVASMMFSHAMLYPFAKFVFARNGALAVVDRGTDGVGGLFTEGMVKAYEKAILGSNLPYWVERVHTPPGPRVDDRMIPAM
jgi:hypothetical protein